MEKKEIPVTDGDNQQEEKSQAERNESVVEENAYVEESNASEEEEVPENVEHFGESENVEKEEIKEVKHPENELEQVKAELSEMKDKYLRLYAEFDNYRKRTLRERENLVKTAGQGTIKAILPVLDDFERAIKMADADDSTESMPDGIRLIYEKMFKSLKQLGLQAMKTKHESFDPDLHEALTKIPAPSDDLKGKIIETVEKGYYLKDKIIRHAKVVIGQ